MDLKTTYLGMELRNPIVPSASILSEKVDNIEQMAEAGAAAVVLHSLFEEQIIGESRQLDHFLSYGEALSAEAFSYFPDVGEYIGPQEYLEHIREAKKRVDIPIIASLNGISVGGWIEYARLIEEAGADALELNIYYVPTNVELTGTEVEQNYLDVVKAVKENVNIPIAAKLSPFFSSIPNMAQRLADTGVDALVLFNRFYDADLDIENLEAVPSLTLSTSADLLLPLRWIAILYGQVPVDLALSSGVHTHEDVLKGLMAGAKVTMMASALLRHGIGHIRTVLEDMTHWMEEHEYESVRQMQGSLSMKHIPNPAALERANYMKVLHAWRPDPTGRLQ